MFSHLYLERFIFTCLLIGLDIKYHNSYRGAISNKIRLLWNESHEYLCKLSRLVGLQWLRCYSIKVARGWKYRIWLAIVVHTGPTAFLDHDFTAAHSSALTCWLSCESTEQPHDHLLFNSPVLALSMEEEKRSCISNVSLINVICLIVYCLALS